MTGTRFQSNAIQFHRKYCRKEAPLAERTQETSSFTTTSCFWFIIAQTSLHTLLYTFRTNYGNLSPSHEDLSLCLHLSPDLFLDLFGSLWISLWTAKVWCCFVWKAATMNFRLKFCSCFLGRIQRRWTSWCEWYRGTPFMRASDSKVLSSVSSLYCWPPSLHCFWQSLQITTGRDNHNNVLITLRLENTVCCPDAGFRSLNSQRDSRFDSGPLVSNAWSRTAEKCNNKKNQCNL